MHKSLKQLLVCAVVALLPIAALAANTDNMSSSNSNTGTEYQSEQNSSQTSTNVESYTLRNLPDKGLVQVSGTVEKLKKNEFTLKDSTGKTITVHYNNLNKHPAIKKNSTVTVVGKVNKGMLSKSINATRVTLSK